jgi:cystathionine gamma-synthase
MDPSTVAVALGRGDRAPGGPLSVPPVLTSTYHAEGDYLYGRDANPTWEAFEEVLGALEGGRCLSFASGLAAVSAVLEAVPLGGVVVVARDAYNGTRRLLSDLEAKGRVAVRAVDITDVDATAAALPGAAMLWLESPTNPLMAVADLAALTELGRAAGARVVVDNTFATPLLQRPLDLGAPVVVHSVTKFLSGHSDVVMGAVITDDDGFFDHLTKMRSLRGAIPGPLEAFLALRGVRTLPVRLERAQATAGELAARLTIHPTVERVRYPGLPSDPGHALAARQMRGFGAMLSFEVRGGAAAADAVCAAVQLLVPATSLGGVETLIERRGRWQGEENTPPSLLRMSVGLEHVDDLWRDLDAALAAV